MSREAAIRDLALEYYLKGQEQGMRSAARAFFATVDSLVAGGASPEDARDGAIAALARYADGSARLDTEEVKRRLAEALGATDDL